MRPIEIRINLQLDRVNILCQNISVSPESDFFAEYVVKSIVKSLDELGVNNGDNYYKSIIIRLIGALMEEKNAKNNLLLMEAVDLLNFDSITQQSLERLVKPSRLVDLINFANKAMAVLKNPTDDLNYASLMAMLEKGIKPIC